MQNDFAVWVGIDWADKRHFYALHVSGKAGIRRGTLLQKSSSITEWVESLRKIAKGGKVAVALEQSKGGLIFALMKYDFIVLYPINPRAVAKYRETWSGSGAKDDPTDAALILELVELHHKKFTPWVPEPENVRLLQRLTENRVHLINDMKRLGNKLTSALKDYFPEVLDMFPKIYRSIVADFLLTYPTLELAQKASNEELIAFFRSHAASKSLSRIERIRNAVVLTSDPAVLASNTFLVQALARQLKVLNDSIALFDKEIQRVYVTLPDRPLFDSLPSAGEVSAPRILAAMGTDRSRFSTSDELANFASISPVREKSGDSCWIHMRFKCNKPIRQAFVEWTFLSLRSCFWAEELYKKLRAKGKKHSAAIRAIAFKWVRIIFRMWKDRTPYSEAKYLKALQKSGSPLISSLSEKSS